MNIAAFEVHGFIPLGESGNQVYGTCPFCGRMKFYLNPQEGTWDCKSGSCSRRGNLQTFLEQIADFYQDYATEADWSAFSADRGIQAEVLKRQGWVFDGVRWLLPVRSILNTVQDLRMYRLPQAGRKSRVMSTKGCKTGLWGIERSTLTDDEPVFVCEGEWDAAALMQLEAPGLVVCVPGCNVWKEEWSNWLQSRTVYLLYDNDQAGQQGVARVQQMLSPHALRVGRLVWPEGSADGKDIRDLLQEGASWEAISALLQEGRATGPGEPAKALSRGQQAPEIRNDEQVEALEDYEAVKALFSKWLYLTEEAEWALQIIFAVVLSTQLPGDPLWVYLVAPPGGCKTELLMTLQDCEDVEIRSTVTAHSLVSGFALPGGRDPSLLPLLHGKCFVLKDYTEIWALPKAARDEITAILRGAYDGVVEKTFGNGITRRYEIHFSMLAGATPQIYGDRQANLGERFLKFRMGSVGGRADWAVRAALSNVNMEQQMRFELSSMARRFVVGLKARMDRVGVPELPDWFIDQLVALSQLLALLRGEVEWDARGERLLYMPQPEVGTRVAKQLKKLALALGVVTGEKWEAVWKIVQKVALDSCTAFNRTVCGYLLEEKRAVSASELSELTGIPLTTLRSQLEDMKLLGILETDRVPNPAGRGAPLVTYRLSSSIVDLCDETGITAMGEALRVRKIPRHKR